MALTVWKFALKIADVQGIDMPVDAKILAVQVQRGTPCLWALVNKTGIIPERRTFAIYGTGHPIPDEPGTHIGTFQVDGGTLVFHVFEVKE